MYAVAQLFGLRWLRRTAGFQGKFSRCRFVAVPGVVAAPKFNGALEESFVCAVGGIHALAIVSELADITMHPKICWFVVVSHFKVLLNE
jgi:hypothetical protein